MYKTIISALVGFFASMAYSEEILSSMASEEFSLNVQSGDIQVASVTEISPVEFDTQWAADDTNVVARFIVNGVVERESAGFGQIDWIPPTAGVYHVSCQFYRDGEEEVGSALNASFDVAPVTVSITPEPEIVSGVPFAVTMECSDPSAVIHYTTDGSAPDAESAIYSNSLEFDSNVVVRAVGIVRDSFAGTECCHQYVHAVPSPVISPGSGSTFALDSCSVSISVDLPNAVIYYTTNGSSPRLNENYRYKGPFDVTGSAKIRAIAVFQTLKSEYVDASITKVKPVAPSLPVISPGDGCQFRGGSCEVSIAVPCEGSSVYYTVDGSEPLQVEACRYKAPFVVTETVTVKAIAVHDGIVSDCAMATLTKVVLDVQGTVGSQVVKATTGGEADWVSVWDVSLDGTDAIIRSGAMGDAATGDGNVSWVELSVEGAGTLSFWWKVDCEHDDSGECTWDRVTYYVDSCQQGEMSIDGQTGWSKVDVPFLDSGNHKVKIEFYKDTEQDSDYSGEDCAWVGKVSWDGFKSDPIPDIGETPTAADVAAAVADATDPKVTANIDETNYNAFRSWAGTVKAKGGSAAGSQGVMNADNAWMSYALGQDTLLDVAPTDEDLSVETFEPAAESGKFDFTVSVKDIEIGSEAVKENLKKVFGLEGASTLDGAAFSSDKVDIEFGTPVDGKVKFTAGPKDASAGAFFMKVKMMP